MVAAVEVAVGEGAALEELLGVRSGHKEFGISSIGSGRNKSMRSVPLVLLNESYPSSHGSISPGIFTTIVAF